MAATRVTGTRTVQASQDQACARFVRARPNRCVPRQQAPDVRASVLAPLLAQKRMTIQRSAGLAVPAA
ncbi:hypothetical protein JR065_02345 [Xanthomonas sp. AmX2]|uniref:hypothetical protein n=1 Tax=Xanthomonas sp. TaxID=29446 RepID=UPI001981B720|nr:hypothetical protein [Xanthomonas sp.]MBN6149168.1 hypothetical protein [Xanthomonas sp.]